MLIILKFICLFLAVMYAYSNTVKIIIRQRVTFAMMFLMTFGIVGFVFIQFKLYL